MIYEVEGPDGKIIPVEGPDDATDDELTSVARRHYLQSKTPAAKPAAAKPTVKAESDAIVPGQMPALSKPEDLAKENASRAPGPKQEQTTQPTESGSVFEPLSRGEYKEAWQNIPQTTRDLALYGTPPVAAGLAAAGMGLKYLKSKFGSDAEIKPSGDGIRSRTIGGNAPTPTAGVAERIEPTFNPKEAKIAADIENKYGFSWKDIKSNFGVSDVTITNPLEAQMLADSYKNQQAAPTATPQAPAAPTTTAPTTAAPAAPAKPALPPLPEAQPGEQAMTVRGQKPVPMSALTTPEAIERAKVVLGGDTPERVLYNLNLVNQRGGIAPWEVHAILGNQGMPSNKNPGTFEEPIPVKTTQATPAPPPAETPKAAVPPEKLTKEQKGMKNHLVSLYGGGPEGEAAYAKVKEILGETPEFPKGKGGSLSPEQTKIIKDWRKVNIEGPKVNLTNDMKKALKGGGGLAVLAAIPGFAEAASNRDFGKMTDIATDFLVLPFAQSREVGEGEQFELAKRRYEGMVGGGRGIAPPSAYQR